MTLPTFLEPITRLLREASIPYMITGSLASSFYGRPRSTQDVDLVFEASEREGRFNAVDPDRGWKAGFIVRKRRPFSVSEFERRRSGEVLGLEVFLPTPEDLIVAKLEWARKGGSDLQLRHVRSILRMQGDRLDRE